MKALRITLTVLLSILLLLALLVTGTVFSLRQSCTPERIHHRFNEIIWGDITIPDRDGDITIREMYNRELGLYLGEADRETFEEVVSYLSIDTVILSLVQDIRSWALDYGPLPRLDPGKITKIVLSGMSDQTLRLIGQLGDPEEILFRLVGEIIGDRDFGESLKPYEDYRFFISDSLLYLAASTAGILFLLLLLLHGLRPGGPMLSLGICMMSGSFAIGMIKSILDSALRMICVSMDVSWSTFDLIYGLFSFYPVIVLGAAVGLALILLGAVVLAVTAARNRPRHTLTTEHYYYNY